MKQVNAAEFWKWAYSDFLSNAQRGVLAEFIVAMAACCTEKPRVEWDACDLEAPTGLRIEVKCGACLQSWQQKGLSAIRFEIAPRKAWNARTNECAETARRYAQVYVFCVFATLDKSSANPLDLEQWFSLVCPTHVLDETFGNQKSVALASLEGWGLQRLGFEALRKEPDRVVADSSCTVDQPKGAE